jgi:hypothetical protein
MRILVAAVPCHHILTRQGSFRPAKNDCKYRAIHPAIAALKGEQEFCGERERAEQKLTQLRLAKKTKGQERLPAPSSSVVSLLSALVRLERRSATGQL